MPDRNPDFDAFVEALVDHQAVCAALHLADPTSRYIEAQVYAYTSQAEAGAYYREEGTWRAALNAALAGIAGVCTMYLGGLIMGVFARSAGIGLTAAESTAAGEAALARGGFKALAHHVGYRTAGTLSFESFVETTVLEATLGLPVRGGLGLAGSVATDTLIGRHRWSSVTVAPAGAALGGILRVGPVLGLLGGRAGGQFEAALEARWREELTRPGVDEVIERAMMAAGRTLDARIKSCGRYASLLLASPDTLDHELRAPMSDQIEKLTDTIALQNRGIIWDADRAKIHAGVAARFGAEIWAPISRQTHRAHTTLRLDHRRTSDRLMRAARRWAGRR